MLRETNSLLNYDYNTITRLLIKIRDKPQNADDTDKISFLNTAIIKAISFWKIEEPKESNIILNIISRASNPEFITLKFLDRTIKEECLTRTLLLNIKKNQIKNLINLKTPMIFNLISLALAHIIEEAKAIKNLRIKKILMSCEIKIEKIA